MADIPDGRGRRRLSLDLIVDHALDLIEDRGVAAATMRGLGDTLGVQAMSLYRSRRPGCGRRCGRCPGWNSCSARCVTTGSSTTAAVDAYRRFNAFLLGALFADSATATLRSGASGAVLDHIANRRARSPRP